MKKGIIFKSHEKSIQSVIIISRRLKLFPMFQVSESTQDLPRQQISHDPLGLPAGVGVVPASPSHPRHAQQAPVLRYAYTT